MSELKEKAPTSFAPGSQKTYVAKNTCVCGHSAHKGKCGARPECACAEFKGLEYYFIMPCFEDYRKLVKRDEIRVNPDSGEMVFDYERVYPLLEEHVTPKMDYRKLTPFQVQEVAQAYLAFLFHALN